MSLRRASYRFSTYSVSMQRAAWYATALLFAFGLVSILSIGVVFLIAACIAATIALVLEASSPDPKSLRAMTARAAAPCAIALVMGVIITINRITSPNCTYVSGSATPPDCSDTLAVLGPSLILAGALVIGALAIIGRAIDRRKQ